MQALCIIFASHSENCSREIKRKISRQPVKKVDFICDKPKTTLYVDESKSIALKHKQKHQALQSMQKCQREREDKCCRIKHVFYCVSLVVLLVLMAFLPFFFSLCASFLLFLSLFHSLFVLSPALACATCVSLFTVDFAFLAAQPSHYMSQ